MRRTCTILAAVLLLAGPVVADSTFNGHGEYQTDQYGYYYAITGGKFPTGTTPNGSSASGGTFRYLTDDPAWGYPIDTWRKDGWFSDNAGLALTMKNGSDIVYDNNGLEDGTYGDYYDANGSHGLHGLYRGYSMSNNFDWIYAGYFKVESDITVTSITGYFDANGNTGDPVAFNPFDSQIGYRMNIWSNVAGDLLPTNTGGFAGDVLTTDGLAGVTIAVSDTGVSRIMPSGSLDPIYRVTFTFDSPFTLAAGEYWFSHDATIIPAPGAALLAVLGLGLIGWLKRRVA